MVTPKYNIGDTLESTTWVTGNSIPVIGTVMGIVKDVSPSATDYYVYIISAGGQSFRFGQSECFLLQRVKE